MTIEQESVIDFVSIGPNAESINLTISDHLVWDDENEKLILLQNKLNAYLAYIETEQIYENNPEARRLDIQIKLACKYEPNSEGLKFLELVRSTVDEAGYLFSWKVG